MFESIEPAPVEAPEQALQAAGHHVVVGVLGRGSMGVVYPARKALEPEARVLASINRPNVATPVKA